ncbi:hypothetical protein RIF29_16836 [Crotalaria pallida]|uniref:Uncharacterized protein n=1 Tax=Crotalaria pallida TaxID=3830 RepID=A0AAN9FG85_CROPI
MVKTECFSPSFLSSGNPAMNSKSCLADDFAMILDIYFMMARIANIVQREHGKSCIDLLSGHQNNKDIVELRNLLETFASQFAVRGLNIRFQPVNICLG